MGEEHITKSYSETENIGKKFAATLKAGEIVGLYGDLGAGKTTFVKGIAKGFGVSSRIISPTFVIVREHVVKDRRGIERIYHIDLYRLEKETDILGIHLQDIFKDRHAIVLIEWPEKIESVLHGHWKICFINLGEQERKIKIEKHA